MNCTGVHMDYLAIPFVIFDLTVLVNMCFTFGYLIALIKLGERG